MADNDYYDHVSNEEGDYESFSPALTATAPLGQATGQRAAPLPEDPYAGEANPEDMQLEAPRRAANYTGDPTTDTSSFAAPLTPGAGTSAIPTEWTSSGASPTAALPGPSFSGLYAAQMPAPIGRSVDSVDPIKFVTNSQGRKIPIDAEGNSSLKPVPGSKEYLTGSDNGGLYFAQPNPDGTFNRAEGSLIQRPDGKGRLRSHVPGLGFIDQGEDTKYTEAQAAKLQKEQDKQAKAGATAQAKADAANLEAQFAKGSLEVSTAREQLTFQHTAASNEAAKAETAYKAASDTVTGLTDALSGLQGRGASPAFKTLKDQIHADNDRKKAATGGTPSALAINPDFNPDDDTSLKLIPPMGADTRKLAEDTLAKHEQQVAELKAQIQAAKDVRDRAAIDHTRAVANKQLWIDQQAVQTQALDQRQAQLLYNKRVKVLTNTGCENSQEAQPAVTPPPADNNLKNVDAPQPSPEQIAQAGTNVVAQAAAVKGENLQAPRVLVAGQAPPLPNPDGYTDAQRIVLADLSQSQRGTVHNVADGSLKLDGTQINNADDKPVADLSMGSKADPVPRVYLKPDSSGQLHSMSLNSGHPYDGVPEYLSQPPVDGHWQPEKMAKFITDWQGANDHERQSIIAQTNPEQAKLPEGSRALDTRQLAQSGQISLQDARHLDFVSKGRAPGIMSPQDSLNEFKAKPYAAPLGLDQSLPLWVADYHKRNSNSADFDAPGFVQFVRDSRDAARAALDKTNPDTHSRWQNTDKMDAGVGDVLRQAQGRAMDEWRARTFPDGASDQFLAQYDKAGGDPTKMLPEYSRQAGELNALINSPQFKPPYERRMMTGSIASGDQKLAMYQTRDIDGGKTEVLMQPRDKTFDVPLTVATPKPAELSAAADKAAQDAAQIQAKLLEMSQNPEDFTPTKGLEDQAKALTEKAKMLRGPQGMRVLTDDRIKEAIRSPEFAGKLSQYNLGGDFVNGVANATFNVGALVGRPLDLAAGTHVVKNMTDAKQGLGTYGGSTRQNVTDDFWGKNAVNMAEGLGEMTPMIAGGLAAKAGAAGLGALGEESSLGQFGLSQGAEMAANPYGVGAGGVIMGAGAAGGSYIQTQQMLDEAQQRMSAAVEKQVAAKASGDTKAEAEAVAEIKQANTDSKRIRAGRDAHAVVTGLIMGGFSKISPLHNLQTSGAGVGALALDVAKQTAEMPLMMAAQNVADRTALGTDPDYWNQVPGYLVQGLGLGLTFGGITHGLQAMSSASAKAEQNRRTQAGFKKWADDYSTLHPDSPITAETAQQAHNYLDQQMLAQRQAAIAALAPQAEELRAKVAARTATPAEWQQVSQLDRHVSAIVDHTNAAVKAAQEVNGVADPATRGFAHGILKSFQGGTLTPSEADGVLRMVDTTAQPDVNGQYPSLAPQQPDGSFILTDAGIGALKSAIPATYDAFGLPVSETAQLDAMREQQQAARMPATSPSPAPVSPSSPPPDVPRGTISPVPQPAFPPLPGVYVNHPEAATHDPTKPTIHYAEGPSGRLVAQGDTGGAPESFPHEAALHQYFKRPLTGPEKITLAKERAVAKSQPPTPDAARPISAPVPEHPGVSPGQDLPGNGGQVRQAEGGQAGGSRGVQPAGEVEPVQKTQGGQSKNPVHTIIRQQIAEQLKGTKLAGLVKFHEAEPAHMALKDGQEQSGGLGYTPKYGAGRVDVSLPTIERQARTDNWTPKETRRRVALMLDEELQHHADELAMQSLHKESGGKPEDYNAWKKEYGNQQWANDFTEAQKAAVLKQYGSTLDTQPDYIKAAEARRMLLQLRKGGGLTETWHELSKGVTEWLQKTVAAIRDMAKGGKLTKGLQDHLEAAEALLKEHGYKGPNLDTGESSAEVMARMKAEAVKASVPAEAFHEHADALDKAADHIEAAGGVHHVGALRDDAEALRKIAAQKEAPPTVPSVEAGASTQRAADTAGTVSPQEATKAALAASGPRAVAAKRAAEAKANAVENSKFPASPSDKYVKEPGIGAAVLRFLNNGREKWSTGNASFLTRRRKSGEESTRKVTSIRDMGPGPISAPTTDSTIRHVVAVYPDGAMKAVDLGSRHEYGGATQALTHSLEMPPGDYSHIVVVDDTGEGHAWGGGTLVKVYENTKGSGAKTLESGEAENAASTTLRKSVTDLPAAAQKVWTPDALAKAEAFFKDGDAKHLDGLTTIQQRKVHAARLESDPTAAAADQAQEDRLRREQADDLRHARATTEPGKPLASAPDQPDWKLRDPTSKLTPKEQEWFDWAKEGASDALNDQSWIRDNEDALTPEGQIEDMRYRLEDQAHDVAETDSTMEQARARHRSIESLLEKLRSEKYFDRESHPASTLASAPDQPEAPNPQEQHLAGLLKSEGKTTLADFTKAVNDGLGEHAPEGLAERLHKMAFPEEAPKPAVEPEKEVDPTGITKAAVEARRKAMGKEPLLDKVEQSWGKLWDKAKRALTKDPQAGDKLVAELTKTKRIPEAWENALLARTTVERLTDVDEAAEQITKLRESADLARRQGNDAAAKTADDARIDAHARLTIAQERMDEIEKVTDKGGTEQGRALNARKLIAKNVIDFHSMVKQLEALRDGVPLTDAEKEQVLERSNALKAQQKAVDKVRQAQEAEAAKAKVHTANQETQAKVRQRGPAMRVVDSLKRKYQSVRDAILQKRRAPAGSLNAAPPEGTLHSAPDDPLHDFIEVGKYHLADGKTDYTDWKAAMLTDFGDEARPHLEEAFRRASEEVVQDQKSEAAAKTPAGVLAKAKAKGLPEAGEEVDPKLVRDLARAHIEAGHQITDEASSEALTGKIHNDLKDLYPDATHEDIRNAAGGYKEPEPRTREEAEKMAAEYRTQSQLVSKLEDAAKGKMPWRMGGWDKPSDEVRRLSRAVRDMIDEQHLIPEDKAKEMANAQERARTLLNNTIADLERQVKAGVRDMRLGGNKTEFDADMKAKQARIETLREQVAKLNTPDMHLPGALFSEAAAKLAAAKTREAELQEKLRNNVLDVKARKPDVSHLIIPELATVRDNIAKLNREVAERRRAAGKLDEQMLARLKKAVQTRGDKMASQIKSGDFSMVKKEPYKYGDDKLAAEAQKEQAKLNVLKKNWAGEKEKARLATRTKLGKAYDIALKVRRASILSSYVTAGKLGTAAAYQTLAMFPDEVAGGLLSRIPGISSIAAKAPIEGGMNLSSVGRSVVKGWVEGITNFGKHVREGGTELDKAHDPNFAVHHLNHSWLDYIGAMHSALKAPAKIAAFEHAMTKALSWAEKNGQDPHDPVVQAWAADRAYKRAERAVFANDNVLSDWWKDSLRGLERTMNKPGSTKAAGARALHFAMSWLFPITKVPVNIFAAGLSRSPLGLGRGIGEAAHALWTDSVSKLSDEQADAVMRHLKDGSVGTALWTLGFLAAGSVGGFYQREKAKRNQQGVPPDRFRLGGVGAPVTPSWATHSPLLDQITMGATYRHIADSIDKTTWKKRGNSPMTAAQTLFGLADHVPFVSTPKDLARAEESDKAGSLWLGNQVQSLVPAIARDYAAGKGIPESIAKHLPGVDVSPEGKEIKRTTRPAHPFLDKVQEALPYRRATLPRAKELPTSMAPNPFAALRARNLA